MKQLPILIRSTHSHPHNLLLVCGVFYYIFSCIGLDVGDMELLSFPLQEYPFYKLFKQKTISTHLPNSTQHQHVGCWGKVLSSTWVTHNLNPGRKSRQPQHNPDQHCTFSRRHTHLELEYSKITQTTRNSGNNLLRFIQRQTEFPQKINNFHPTYLDNHQKLFHYHPHHHLFHASRIRSTRSPSSQHSLWRTSYSSSFITSIQYSISSKSNCGLSSKRAGDQLNCLYFKIFFLNSPQIHTLC